MGDIRSNVINILWEHPHEICALYVIANTLLAFAIGYPKRLYESINFDRNPKIFTQGDFYTYFGFGIFLGVIAAVIPSGESMTWYDSNIFFSTLTGKQFYPAPIWPGAGRLFPLAHQEFQFLSHISPTFLFYHVFSSIQLVVICSTILWWGKSLPRWTVIVLIGILTTPSIVSSFSEIIYPERNMILLLIAIILCGEAWGNRGSLPALILATASAAALMLYKETSIILVGFGAVSSLSTALLKHKDGHRQRLLIWSGIQALICASWMAVYAGIIVPSITNKYAAPQYVTGIIALKSFISQPWTWLLLLLTSIRFYQITKNKFVYDSVWDGALLSSITYSLAIIKLHFTIPYYTAPASFLTWLCTLHYIKEHNVKFFRIFIIIIITVQIPSIVKLFENQKEIVDAKAQATAYLSAIGSIQPQPLRIHFPQSNRYEAGLITGLLQTEYDVHAFAGINSAVSDSAFSDCTSDIRVACAENMAMKKGDFIVGLGDKIQDKNYRLVFKSKSIGFWKNSYFVYIYIR